MLQRKPLYVSRAVLNAADIGAWYRKQGFDSVVVPEDMHVTVAYSRTPVSWKIAPAAGRVELPSGCVGPVSPLGPKGAVVAFLHAPELHTRWVEFCNHGCSWDYDGYKPHMTLTYNKPPVDLLNLDAYPGAVYLGPERFETIQDSFEVVEKAVIIDIPAVIKSSTLNGKRVLEVEASSEAVDSEGDKILQEGLLASAQGFLMRGHIDIDHISELGHRYGIRDTAQWVVGKPIDVKDIGGGRTAVVCELNDMPQATRVWESLKANPPAVWKASVYGFPTSYVDCRSNTCASDVKRLLITGFDWRSLALTQNPVNKSLTGYARIVSAKAWFEPIAKAMSMPSPDPPTVDPQAFPEDMNILHTMGVCGKCGVHNFPSSPAYKAHFVACHGMPIGKADICAHAIMHSIHKAENMAGMLGLVR